MMLFPEENNITHDINSAIKSLSLIILGSDLNPSVSSQKNFSKSLRNIVEQLFKLQHGEQDFEINEESLAKVEDLAQQAVDWRINYNNTNQLLSASEVEPVEPDKKKQKLDHENGNGEKSSGKSTDSPAAPLKQVGIDLKILISIHTLCWGTTFTSVRFRELYPDYQISKSGITMWVKRLPSLLKDCLMIAKRAIKKFDEQNPQDIPLRYIYECRQKLLHKRNILKYKITKLDIRPVIREVLEKAGIKERYSHWIRNDEFCEKLFHASSKINFEKNNGTTKEFFANHPTWFLD